MLAGNRLSAQNYFDPAFSFNEVRNIYLESLEGKKVNIRKSDAPLYLFVFISPECPLCKNYSTVLNRLSQQFENKLKVYGLVPGMAYSKKELKDFTEEYRIDFPLLIDGKKEFSRYIQAAVTPEVVLVDNTGKIIYRGAIDDWVQELGKKKLKPEENYLENAINQYLDGAPVLVKKTIPKGCLINEF